MAKFEDMQEQFSGGDYVKKESLLENGTVFNVVDAQVVTSNFKDKVTDEPKQDVEFTIQYADPEESEGIAQKKFSMELNSFRGKFVDYFNNSGEKLEDMEICKLASTGKGNPPWGFKASAREAFPKTSTTLATTKGR